MKKSSSPNTFQEEKVHSVSKKQTSLINHHQTPLALIHENFYYGQTVKGHDFTKFHFTQDSSLIRQKL